MIRPITNDHSGAWHVERFIAFAHAKAAIGEPTPHMRVVDYLCKGVSDEERVWRAGAYLTAYSVISGEAIWTHWSHSQASADPEALLPWLRENWAGIHTRKPRRCVRTPEKFATSLRGYLHWMGEKFPRLRALRLEPRAEYDEWWHWVKLKED